VARLVKHLVLSDGLARLVLSVARHRLLKLGYVPVFVDNPGIEVSGIRFEGAQTGTKASASSGWTRCSWAGTGSFTGLDSR